MFPDQVKALYLEQIQAYRKGIYDKCHQYKIDFNDIKILNKSQLTGTIQNLSLKFNMMNEVSKKNKHRYIKVLGSLTEDEYHTIINKPQYDTVTVDDASVFQMMFGKDSSLRKEYMFA